MADHASQSSASPSGSQPDEAKERSPEQTLQRLVSALAPDRKEWRQLIIDAEVIDFEPHHLARLALGLSRFIGDSLSGENDDPAEVIALGAAIRKYVATMGINEAFTYVAELLSASPDAAFSTEIELESTKMVVRKLMANPIDRDDPFPELADRLMEIARTYLHPRLLAQEKYGAIALNVIFGLVLLRSRHVAEVLRLVAGLRADWFQKALARRARQILGDLKERHPGRSMRSAGFMIEAI